MKRICMSTIIYTLGLHEHVYKAQFYAFSKFVTTKCLLFRLSYIPTSILSICIFFLISYKWKQEKAYSSQKIKTLIYVGKKNYVGNDDLTTTLYALCIYKLVNIDAKIMKNWF